MRDRQAVDSSVAANRLASLQRAFERMGPSVAQRFDRALDDCAPLTFDAESRAAGDLADGFCRYTILSRTLENAGKRGCLDRDDGAGAALVEQGLLGGGFAVEVDGDAAARQ